MPWNGKFRLWRSVAEPLVATDTVRGGAGGGRRRGSWLGSEKIR